MGFLSKYNSSAANTNLTVNINSGKQLHVTYQFNTGRITYNITTNSSSNIYYIKGAISNKKVIIKIAKQNYQSLLYGIMNSTGSSFTSVVSFNPNKIWEKNGYIYIQFNSLTLSSSQSLAIFKYDHSTSSSSNSQTYYYGVNMIEAIIAPKWINSNPKIYDDGTQKTIPPTIALNNYYNGSSFIVTTTLYQTRFWEVSSGKTYKIRCNANTTAESNSSVKALSSRDISTATSTFVTTTKTTDSQTGETLYTFTAPSGYPLVCFMLTGPETATYSMETIDPRLEGKRTAKWYDVDDYGFSTVWESTGY